MILLWMLRLYLHTHLHCRVGGVIWLVALKRFKNAECSNLCINLFGKRNDCPKGQLEDWFVVPVHDWVKRRPLSIARSNPNAISHWPSNVVSVRLRKAVLLIQDLHGRAAMPSSQEIRLPPCRLPCIAILKVTRFENCSRHRQLRLCSTQQVVQPNSDTVAPFAGERAESRGHAWGARTANALLQGLRSLR